MGSWRGFHCVPFVTRSSNGTTSYPLETTPSATIVDIIINFDLSTFSGLTLDKASFCIAVCDCIFQDS